MPWEGFRFILVQLAFFDYLIRPDRSNMSLQNKADF